MSINLERYSKSPYETEEAWKRLAAIVENDDEAIASDEYKKYCLKSEESLLLNVFGILQWDILIYIYYFLI